MAFFDAIGSAFGFVDDLFYTNQEKADAAAVNTNTQTQQNAIDAGVYTTQVNAQIAQQQQTTIIIAVAIIAAIAVLFLMFRK